MVSSSNTKPVCWWKEPSSCWISLLHQNPVFNFTYEYNSCIICYHANQVVEVFHFLQLFLICYNMLRDGCLEIFITLVLLHSFPFHNIFQLQTGYYRFVASSTSLSAFLHYELLFVLILKPPNPSKTYWVRVCCTSWIESMTGASWSNSSSSHHTACLHTQLHLHFTDQCFAAPVDFSILWGLH